MHKLFVKTNYYNDEGECTCMCETCSAIKNKKYYTKRFGLYFKTLTESGAPFECDLELQIDVLEKKLDYGSFEKYKKRRQKHHFNNIIDRETDDPLDFITKDFQKKFEWIRSYDLNGFWSCVLRRSEMNFDLEFSFSDISDATMFRLRF